ncbi:hypothetical protein R6Q57_021286 [Mikania cordata]
MNCFDDSEICAEKLSSSGQVDEKEERSARKSTHCYVVLNKSNFSVPKIDYIGKFETVNIKRNKMVQNFKTKFVKTYVDAKYNCVLKKCCSKIHENKLHSTITKVTGPNLNPNCEPYVPNELMEQVSPSSAPSSSDCDKVTPKAKPISKPKRIEKLSKPNVKQQKKARNHHPSRPNKIKQNQNGFQQQKKTKISKSETKTTWKGKSPLKPNDSGSMIKPIDHSNITSEFLSL